MVACGELVESVVVALVSGAPEDGDSDPAPGVGEPAVNDVPETLSRCSELPSPAAPFSFTYEIVSAVPPSELISETVSAVLLRSIKVSMTVPTEGYSARKVVASSASIAYPPLGIVNEPMPPFCGGTFSVWLVPGQCFPR